MAWLIQIWVANSSPKYLNPVDNFWKEETQKKKWKHHVFGSSSTHIVIKRMKVLKLVGLFCRSIINSFLLPLWMCPVVVIYTLWFLSLPLFSSYECMQIESWVLWPAHNIATFTFSQKTLLFCVGVFSSCLARQF